MKKKLVLLLGVMLIIAFAGAITINLVKTANQDTASQGKKLKIVATFYPVYLIGLNIADQIGDIEISSLTKLNTGCLHDYQLTTEDMRLISEADVLVINGGGMESFLKDIKENYPKLTIIDASQGITMLKDDYESFGGEGASRDVEVDEQSGSVDNVAGSNQLISTDNPHVWLDPQLYIRQIENVRDGLISYLNNMDTIKNTDTVSLQQAIELNAQNYIGKITQLDNELTELTDKSKSASKQPDSIPQAVIFHDSFAYLAGRAGLNIAFAVPLDSDTSLSAGDIATIIDAVRQKNIKYLFTEQQYSDSIAKQIAEETDAKVYIIDSVVTGRGDKDSYINAMRGNLEVLQKALQNQ